MFFAYRWTQNTKSGEGYAHKKQTKRTGSKQQEMSCDVEESFVFTEKAFFFLKVSIRCRAFKFRVVNFI